MTGSSIFLNKSCRDERPRNNSISWASCCDPWCRPQSYGGFVNPTRLVCELNAWFATQLFEWLVGPCQVTATPITQANGTTAQQNSCVHIQKCRYLEQSGCVGMCINMCKLPTQDFFTREFGIPVTLNPNFEDLSCDMIFGQIPPPLSTEEIYHQPCLTEQCDSAPTLANPASTPRPCPKVRSGSSAEQT